MTPAARTLFVRRDSNGGARFFAGLKFQIAQDKKLLQLVVRQRGGKALVTAQHDSGFERVPDQLFLARFLDRLADHGPELKQFLDSFAND